MNNKPISCLLFFVSTMIFAGCSLPAYHEPDSGERARLRVSVRNGGTNLVGVDVLPDGTCASTQVADFRHIATLNGSVPNGGWQGVRIGIPDGGGFTDVQLAEVAVAADKSISLEFSSSSLNWFCRVPFAFTPKSGSDYEAVYSVGNSRCRVDLTRIRRDDDGAYARVPIETQKLTACR
ncbi:hypothetical protein [Burkholderia cepacia]|uniref:hypothetical protein n=1 Tax=Burkholderia cepacia TaxID=292 RepID=UPI0012D434EA|nr:hypothetical protein [Burkholderia cepacia]